MLRQQVLEHLRLAHRPAVDARGFGVASSGPSPAAVDACAEDHRQDAEAEGHRRRTWLRFERLRIHHAANGHRVLHLFLYQTAGKHKLERCFVKYAGLGVQESSTV